jgi:hypothetical protein
VDLTQSVVVGEPELKSALRWSVPYNVQDAAGNVAETIWRDIVVEEVTLTDVETKVRRDLAKETDAKMKRAVDKALEEERRKRSKQSGASAKACPACPKCECPDSSSNNSDGSQRLCSSSACESYCAPQRELNAVLEQSYIYRASLWLERLIPTALIPTVLLTVALLFLTFLWSFLWSVLLSMIRAWTYRPDMYNALDERTERAMRDSVLYALRSEGFASPPIAAGNGNDPFFSPRTATVASAPTTPYSVGTSPGISNGYRGSYSLGDNNSNSIFAADSIITPNRRSDAVRRRTPHSYS